MPTSTMNGDRTTPLREDGATFEVARVRSGRGPRRLLAAIAVLFSGLVALNAFDRAGGDDGRHETAIDAAPAASPTRRPTSDDVTSKRFLNNPEVPATDPPISLLALDLRSAGSHLFVHGDVFSLAVARVSVTLEDAAGHVAGTKAIEVPGGSTAFRLGAVPRFEVQFVLPSEVQPGGFIVSATAVDSSGHRLVTIQERVARTQVSM